MKYPIAETFSSIQGEGFYSGVPMFFIRLAGCNVGAYQKANDIWAQCHTALGQQFLCDTDYKRRVDATEEDLFELQMPKGVKHICLTGGEPFLHDLYPIVSIAGWNGIQVHIETSGTKPIPENVGCDDSVWITCSPKVGFLPENAKYVNEWKFVVAADISEQQEDAIAQIAGLNPEAAIYIQPISHVFTINGANADYALKMVERHPEWRICLQLHKILNVR